MRDDDNNNTDPIPIRHQSRKSSSPQLNRLNEVFENNDSFFLVELTRLDQTINRMIEVIGSSRLAVLDYDYGQEVARYDLRLLTRVSLVRRVPRNVMQLDFVHSTGEERILRLTYGLEDDKGEEELNRLNELLQPVAITNQVARANENVALRTKCLNCQHVLDHEERRFLVEGRRLDLHGNFLERLDGSLEASPNVSFFNCNITIPPSNKHIFFSYHTDPYLGRQ